MLYVEIVNQVRRKMGKLLLALVLVVFLSFASGAGDAEVSVKEGPYVQNVDLDGITIMWETDLQADSRVDYGPTEDYGSHIYYPEKVKIHEIRISGLEKETTYHYKVTSGPVSSDDSTFETAVDSSTPFRFGVYGDSRSDPDSHRRVVTGMVAANPRIVIHVGDVVGNGDNYEEWGREFLRPATELMRSIPLYVAIGNHERNSQWFYEYLSAPEPENWYSFDYGNSHFVVVDTNQDYRPGSPQREWLEGDLCSERAQGAAWLFCFFHHPPYSEGWDHPGYDGSPDVRRYLVPLLEKYGVDIVFSGHTHDYERGFMNGVHYIITGGGGAPLDRWYRGFEHIIISRFVYHFCTVDIDGEKLKLEARLSDGTVFDSMTLQRRPISFR